MSIFVEILLGIALVMWILERVLVWVGVVVGP